MTPDPTYPHDYRIIAGSGVRPTIVGGQAINLWAITYLEAGEGGLSTAYASGDLDLLSAPGVLEFLRGLGPEWHFDRIPFWAFGDGREAIVRGRTPDNRKLLVEVIRTVHGLEAEDLKGVEEVNYAGVTYRVLDPVALLKSKAANVRDLDQQGPPLRHDRIHLQIISRCWLPYLRQVHAAALRNPGAQRAAAKVFSRAFETLLHRPTAVTLAVEGIVAGTLVPAELVDSPVDRIRNAYAWQWPRLQSQRAR